MVVSTRPVTREGIRHNVGYVWDRTNGMVDVHTKVYLPDEPGFWEATWYRPGPKRFEGAHTASLVTLLGACSRLSWRSL